METKIWLSRICIDCKKRHPQWQMHPIKHTVSNAIIGYMCKACFNRLDKA